MANKNDIEIQLKTIAKTGDLADLIAYIHKLGKSLREVGTEDAKVLRNQLAATLKSLPKDLKSVKPEQVKALVPDISKINALGALSGIDKRLAQFGTAQAKAVQQTVKEMRGAIEGGALSDKTIEMLSASLQKFVEQANKLPPAGLKKLAADIQKTIDNTQELQEVIAKANDIEFNVKTDGSGSIGELQHKIEVIANAKNLDDGIKELNAALLTLDSKEAEAVAERLERIKKILEGELGEKQVRSLQEEMKGLAKVSSNLSSRELQRVGGAINSVQAQGEALAGAMKKTGSSIADSFDGADALVNNFSLSLDAGQQQVVALAAKIGKAIQGTKAWAAVTAILPAKLKAVGAAMAALPIGWILALVGAIVTGFKGMTDLIRGAGERLQEIKVGNLKSSLESINSILEAQNHVISDIADKEEARLKTIKEQRDAMHNLAAAQAELNDEREKYGILTEEEKESISIRQDEARAKRDYDKAWDDNRSDLKIAKNDLRKGDDLSEARKDAIRDIRELLSMSDKELKSLDKQSRSFMTQSLSKIGLHFDPEEFATQVREIKSQARSKMQELMKEEDKWQTERMGKQSGIDALNSEADTIFNKYALEQQKIKGRRFDLERGQKQRIHAFEREQEVLDYDTELQEETYQRGKKEPWQNDQQKLETAKKMRDRFLKEEQEAQAARDRVLEEFKKSGRTEMTAEEQTALQEATSDMNRSRSSRYQEQSTIDQLEKSLHDRRFEEKEARHSIAKEDADWERGRIYQRADYAQKLAMDRKRLAEAQKEFAEADAAIQADNDGSRLLSPEERKVMERRRNEARGYITQSREAIANAEYEGDQQKAQFYAGIAKQSNRLTAMGLGGNVADYDRQTASNTKKLVEKTGEMISAIKEGKNAARDAMQWGM